MHLVLPSPLVSTSPNLIIYTSMSSMLFFSYTPPLLVLFPLYSSLVLFNPFFFLLTSFVRTFYHFAIFHPILCPSYHLIYWSTRKLLLSPSTLGLVLFSCGMSLGMSHSPSLVISTSLLLPIVCPVYWSSSPSLVINPLSFIYSS